MKAWALRHAYILASYPGLLAPSLVACSSTNNSSSTHKHRIYCSSSLLVTGVLRLELEFNMHAYTRSPIKRWNICVLEVCGIIDMLYYLGYWIMWNNGIAEQRNKFLCTHILDYATLQSSSSKFISDKPSIANRTQQQTDTECTCTAHTSPEHGMSCILLLPHRNKEWSLEWRHGKPKCMRLVL